jgi:glycerol-3-phosphate dehydrogenase
MLIKIANRWARSGPRVLALIGSVLGFAPRLKIAIVKSNVGAGNRPSHRKCKIRGRRTVGQVLWSYSGVRPLYDDGASEAQEATRDYVLKLDAPEESPPLLSIFGGKITTYRRLAEAALTILSRHLPAARRPAGWTGQDALPGGDFPTDGFEMLASKTAARYPFLPRDTVRRLVRAYGTRAERLLGGARTQSDLGRTFGADLTEAEVLYLAKSEWAMSAADVVWRRSKLGLRMSEAEVQDLDAYLAALQAPPQTADQRGASVG